MIRKYFIFMILLLESVLSVSCQEEISESGQESCTNAVLRAGTVVLDSETEVWMQWEATKDKIGVFVHTSKDTLWVNKYLYAFSSTPVSSFVDLGSSDDISLVKGIPAEVYAYYPYRSSFNDFRAVPCTLPRVQKLASGEVVSLKNDVLLYDAEHDITLGDEVRDIHLKPAFALVKINLRVNKASNIAKVRVSTDSDEPLAFSKGTVNIESGKVAPESGLSSELILEPEGKFSVGPGGTSFVFMVNNVTSCNALILDALVGNEEVTLGSLELPEGGLEGGRMYTFSINYDFPEIIYTDLSAVSTSNTYIVNKPATVYGFRANVKGNGIPRDFSWTFDGQPCNVSWNDVSISPADVKVLWFNTPDDSVGNSEHISPVVVSSLIYDESLGLAFFETPAEFVEGNAVIAAFDQNGDILWSWNIWAVKDYDPDATARKVGRFTAMDRNLGALAGIEAASETNSEKAARSIGNFYQWGRKDPLPAAAGFGEQQTPKWGLFTYTPIEEYKLSGDLIFTEHREDNVFCIGKEKGQAFTLEDAVSLSVNHPHKFMANGTTDNEDPYHWANPPYSSEEKYRTTPERSYWRTLWGSVDGYNSVKTIFDPCPPGWKVPTADFYVYAFGGSLPTANGYGYYSDRFGLFMPNAGQRKAGFGGSDFSGVGTDPMYMSATANDSYTPTRGGAAGMATFNSYGGAAYQVRCVKEEVAESPAPVGFQNGPKAVLMGDSITEQWPVRGRKEFFTENDYTGVGISGQTSRNMLDRFYKDVLSKSPKVVVVTAGTNDLAFNGQVKTCREDVLNNVRLMVELSHDWGSDVIVGSAFPSRHYWWNDGAAFWTFTPDEVAQGAYELYLVLKAYAESRGYEYADYYNVLKDSDGNLADKYCFSFGPGWSHASDGLDRVHPGAEGYLEMEKVLKPLIEKALNSPDQLNPGGSSLDEMEKIEW